MKKLILFSFIILPLLASSQKLHLPNEIVRIMEKSQVTYIIDSLETPHTPLLEKPLKHDYVRTRTDKGYELSIYTPVKHRKASKYLASAEKHYAKEKYNKSKKCLNKALKVTPNNPKITLLQGDIFLKEGDAASAKFWYKKAIQYRFINAKAHSKLSIALAGLNENDKAATHSILAHLFDRNNEAYLSQMINTLKQNGIPYLETSFKPQYKISKITEKKIKISYGSSIWLAYANVMALWEHEPNYYNQQSKISTAAPEVTKYTEALMNASIQYEYTKHPSKYQDYPLISLANFLSKNTDLSIFIIYEILSVEKPEIMLTLDDETLEAVIFYILHTRKTN